MLDKRTSEISIGMSVNKENTTLQNELINATTSTTIPQAKEKSLNIEIAKPASKESSTAQESEEKHIISTVSEENKKIAGMIYLGAIFNVISTVTNLLFSLLKMFLSLFK